MEYSRSFLINIPVPRICAKESNIQVKESLLQRKLKSALKKPQKYSKNSLKKYVSFAKYPIRTEILRRDDVLLPYRIFAKGQDKKYHKDELKVTIQQKYKMSLSEYRNRLHIEDPPNDVRTVTEIDKDFFNYINGRSLTDHAPIYKTLKTMLTHQMRTKLEVAYRKDYILNIESTYRNEIKIYEQSSEMFIRQSKCLNCFIAEDYRKSIALLKICEEFGNNLNAKLVELQRLGDQQFTIVSNLIGLDYMYCLQQSYGRFLYYLSPPSWRANNRKFAQSMEIEVKGFDLGGGDEETFNVIFDKMQKECLSGLVSPALYFTEPQELIELFEASEKQQLSYLEYLTILAPHLKQTKENCKALKNIIVQDSASILNTIKTIEALLDFNEKRCVQLKNKFFKILNGLFYESVGSPEVIKMFLDLEFYYGKLYSDKPINMDIVTIAKDLEAFYMYYWKCLDAILSDKNKIKKTVRQCEEIERKKNRRAKLARKELCIFEHLKNGLIRAFAPPAPRRILSKDNKSVNLNKAIISKKNKNKRSTINEIKSTAKKTLSASELEYLELFTDWTCDEDPSIYLHLDCSDEIKDN